MKFKFERLGLLDYAEIELADLTLICGENNTGKTYATYAIYGFLRSWRQILHVVLESEIDDLLKENEKYQFNLEVMFSEKKLESYFSKMGEIYVAGLHRAFATDEALFNETKCRISLTQSFDLLSVEYQRQVKAGSSGKVIATITKEAESPILEVLVADAESLQRRFGGLSDFIVDAIADIVFSPYLPGFHISSAERTGSAIFRKELDIARTRMLNALHQMDSKELRRNPFLLFKEMDTGYPWPVEDNVDFVRQLEELDKRTGELARTHPEILKAFDDMLGGSYKVIKEQLVFQNKGADKRRFSMNESSSCIRALLDVSFYLRCKARAGEFFIIDEPELNLHPKNQRAFARIVARLVNAGVKVFITTHSDYLIKEINTLIMLNQKTMHSKKVQKDYKYEDDELLDSEKIRLYITDRVLRENPAGGRRIRVRTLTAANIYPDRGIEVPTFDETIELMNEIQGEILYGGEFSFGDEF
ncbi:AAA family ATPase [Alcaligenes sp. SMD-FA]|uniref:AAA family ATPase n=1 Tax=Alcaligenes sp. SMD-FA TaxID=2991054 RepID=UPI0022270625|nr:ATP-binding protein [Alcaligenes sp. SMD-FA]UYY88952.1 ATP-binding protein [Alcaligenes sp. SMD-FA]